MAIIRRVTRIANPRMRRTKVKARRTVKHRRATRSNPVLLEFGMLNPRRKGRKSVARKRKTRRSSNPRRHAVARVHHRRRSTHRRRNPMAVNHHRRRHNTVRHHSRRRRNPMGFATKGLVEQTVGVLLGVSAVRVLPAMVPASITSMIPASPFTGALINAAITFAAYTAASKFAPADVARGVALGGSAIVLSQLWTAMGLPAPPGFGLSGVGDIVPTMGFAVPDRSMRQQVLAMPAAGVGVYGRGNYRRAGF